MACSQAPEPVSGFGGLAFGEGRPADCPPLAVPLPQAVADSLIYAACPRRSGAFFGATVREPVFGFYQGRFFSLSASLAEPRQADALRRSLTRDFGPPYCRDAPKLAVCLWHAGETDVVLETPANGPPRLLLRFRPLARAVAAAGGLSVPAGIEPAGEGAMPAGAP